MARDAPAAPNKPRLCHLRKWSDFDGYGFNLHVEKGRAGHFVGRVDEDSPAVAGGLRQGDRIVEVNGVNVGNENHSQVVERIKSVVSEARLLVVDREGDVHYQQKEILISGSMDNILHRETPITNPYSGRQDAAVESSNTAGDPPDSHNTATGSIGGQDNILELSGSAKEAREKMKKRLDKSADMTLKDKYNLLQKL